MEDRHVNTSMSDAEASWTRVRDHLLAYREAQRLNWGDIDEAMIARYVVGEGNPTERAQVERAARDYPGVRECVDILREVMDSEEGRERESIVQHSARRLVRIWLGSLAAAGIFLVVGLASLFMADSKRAASRIVPLPKPGLKYINSEPIGQVTTEVKLKQNYMAMTEVKLKQIYMAMHSYEAFNKEFPPAALIDKTGKPLLSWRVAILPFLGKIHLYNEFHLDEPWDSPHNKALLGKMPPVYQPVRVTPREGTTFYQVFVGNGAAFDRDKGSPLTEITDETSKTIMVAEAGEAVPWTKPADLDYDPEKPLPKLGGLGGADGWCAAFFDGSVRFIKGTIDVNVLRALITRAGGEVIKSDQLGVENLPVIENEFFPRD
jgi:hypothetical protein